MSRMLKIGKANRAGLALAAAAGVFAAAVSGATPAAAAEWPDKPITIVVPLRAGGGLDRLAKTTATYLSKELGQPVKVINKPGGITSLGMKYVLDQPHDGYHVATVLFPFPFLIEAKKMAGVKVSDFAYVNAQMTDRPVIIVPNSKPYKTLGDLIKSLKANPGKLSYARAPIGLEQYYVNRFLTNLGLKTDDARGVVYTSGGKMLTALIGGQVDFQFAPAQSFHRLAGKVRGIAFFSETEEPVFKAPPINSEIKKLGYKFSFELFDTTLRTFAMPKAVMTKYPDRWKRFVEANRKVLANPEAQAALKKASVGYAWVGPEETARRIGVMGNIFKSEVLAAKKKK